jgi:hypothetical protein
VPSTSASLYREARQKCSSISHLQIHVMAPAEAVTFSRPRSEARSGSLEAVCCLLPQGSRLPTLSSSPPRPPSAQSSRYYYRSIDLPHLCIHTWQSIVAGRSCVGPQAMEPSNKKRRLAPKQPSQEQVSLTSRYFRCFSWLTVPSHPKPATITSPCLLCKMPRRLLSGAISSPSPDTYKMRQCSSMPKQTNRHTQVSLFFSCAGRMT